MSKLELDNSSLTHRLISGNAQRAKMSMTDNAFTFSGANSATRAELLNVAEPTNATSAATKAYVDSQVSNNALGLQWKDPARCRTSADLSASYGSNTITAAVSMPFPETDGVTPAAGDRIMVASQTAAAENGLYTLLDAGAAQTPWVLGRSGDADTPSELTAATVVVAEGTTYGNTMYTQSQPITTLGTDAVQWVQVSMGINAQDAGDALTLSGKYFRVNTDGATIGISSDALQVIDSSITGTQLANDAVGPNQLAGNAVLSASVADLQIQERHLSAGACTADKIADDSIGTQHYAASSVDATAIKTVNVQNQHLAADCVTFDKIAAGACDADAIGSKVITASHIADSSLSETLYGTNSVSARAIAGTSITQMELSNNCVISNKIVDGNVSTQKLDQTVSQEAVTEACIRDLACTRSKIANNAVDATKLAASAVENGAIAAGAITSDKFGVLTSLDVAGGITATDITLSGSGASGAGGYSLAKAVYFNVDFDVDYALTTDFTPIANAAVSFGFADNIMFTTNTFRVVFKGDGTSNGVEFVMVTRYYDAQGVPESEVTPASYDSYSLVAGDTGQMETALLSLSGDGDDKIIHSVSVWGRKTGGGAVVIPAGSDWFGLCSVVQTNSSRQQFSWTAGGLVAQ
jgi:hypothetical protein